MSAYRDSLTPAELEELERLQRAFPVEHFRAKLADLLHRSSARGRCGRVVASCFMCLKGNDPCVADRPYRRAGTRRGATEPTGVTRPVDEVWPVLDE